MCGREREVGFPAVGDLLIGKCSIANDGKEAWKEMLQNNDRNNKKNSETPLIGEGKAGRTRF